MRQCSLFACFDIENVRSEVVSLSVVPDNLVFRARPPLEHTTLLPAPSAAVAELDPAVPVFQIHHSNPDNVVGFGAAVLEIDLHPENIAAGGIELEFVVVAEPVEFWPVGDRADRGQVSDFRFLICDFRFGCGCEGRKSC